MSNRATGNKAEKEFCKLLADKGFWAHNMAQNSAGQPADIHAARNGRSYLIDAKDCSTDQGFMFSRIEPNQRSAMLLWEMCGNSPAQIAIKYNGQWWMFWLGYLLSLEQRGLKRLTTSEIVSGLTFEEWEQRHG